ncbi:anti-sigma factor antagonist [Leptospira levettii]|uniref:Anti-sigma factor antagonist n=2 Tax=Leptospira TaxID=171 RepID=A0ABY2MMS7_9LEPT|nr:MULTISPECIES: STAS domain-containing protein [Leptospira]PKA27412.1 STAS domain protein [Leptospira sp. mixed culture ATI2-C-A1]MCW7463650.1 STAS domain-containing protein [Leptospira limi]MCW7475141.1 STAS domain-containing protein [Leptospira levettii]MCW7497580.1 STAS domain-containing protein [Leptospira levettii]MCW7506668.1 STAS domain-containing protein [Leptospira levettii]
MKNSFKFSNTEKKERTLAVVIQIKNEDISFDGLSGFRERIMSTIQNSKEDVQLDFSEITMSLDSATIGELMKYHAALESQNLQLKLSGVNKLIRTVFRLNKLDTILHLID